MERSPVDASIVTLQNILNHDIDTSKKFSVESSQVVRRRSRFLLESTGVPNTDSLIKGGRHNKVLFGMEGRAHDVVIVARQDGDTSAGLPVPYAHRLIITGAHNPRVLVMELNSANVIEVSEKSKNTPVLLIVPNFDFVIVPCRKKERLMITLKQLHCNITPTPKIHSKSLGAKKGFGLLI